MITVNFAESPGCMPVSSFTMFAEPWSVMADPVNSTVHCLSMVFAQAGCAAMSDAARLSAKTRAANRAAAKAFCCRIACIIQAPR